METSTDYDADAHAIIAKVLQHTGVKLDKQDPFVVFFIEQKKLFYSTLEVKLQEQTQSVQADQEHFIEQLSAHVDSLNKAAELLEQRKQVIVAEMVKKSDEVFTDRFLDGIDKKFRWVVLLNAAALFFAVVFVGVFLR